MSQQQASLKQGQTQQSCGRTAASNSQINQSLILLRCLILSLLAILLSQYAQAAQLESQAIQLGQQYTIDSKELAEQRRINLWLPASYQATGEQTYPVLFVLDGGMDEDFLHIVGLVNYLSTYQRMPETIVIGVVNVDRKRDFTTPSDNPEDRAEVPQHGGSERFIRFLSNELMPWVQQNFRINDERTLLGQSLGGLLGTQVLLFQPDLFKNYLIVSPSLWWNDQKLFLSAEKQLREHAVAERKIYFAVGNEHPAIVIPTRELEQTVGRMNWPGLDSRFDFLGEEDHATALHQAAYRGFIWFYKSALDAGTSH